MGILVAVQGIELYLTFARLAASRHLCGVPELWHLSPFPWVLCWLNRVESRGNIFFRARWCQVGWEDSYLSMAALQSGTLQFSPGHPPEADQRLASRGILGDSPRLPPTDLGCGFPGFLIKSAMDGGRCSLPQGASPMASPAPHCPGRSAFLFCPSLLPSPPSLTSCSLPTAAGLRGCGGP